jgi:tRNA (adenine37-N6)-methyltransferase
LAILAVIGVALIALAPREPAAVGRAVPFPEGRQMPETQDPSAAFTMRPIGLIRSPYTETSQIPKGPGAHHDAQGVIELLPEYEAGLKDVEGFSHLYVLWVFHRSQGYDLVAKPPVDPRPHGVFSTRSPRRPNPIGLTVVWLLHREDNKLHVQGLDMLDGTPVLDIKPLMSGIPLEQLRRGWLDEAEARRRDTAPA